eukprot:TRINITY_DN40562_c0_g1_i1.p1 TRINITY_DN40562_c0_g1~~TRINITY_DN40562_c0_g1_i1.p1  ORF type:complete len:409 (+),score=38.27 TRINITY_DN40562_c0_g1_i1:45-1271(+)
MHLLDLLGQRAPIVHDIQETSIVVRGLAISQLIHEKKSLGLEKGSVYALPLLLPQIGRSLQWPWQFVWKSLVAHFWIVLTFSLQVYLLLSIDREENQMDRYGGRMFLCGFGIGGRGPGGTEITAPRLFNFQAWSLRCFVRDALLQTHPDQENLILSHVDPGEYGAESWICRLICCFLSVINAMHELRNLRETIKLVHAVPTAAESWCKLKSEDRFQNGSYPTHAPLDYLDVKVAGMPMIWKIHCVVFLVLPKICVWLLVLQAGTDFIMETPGIDDMIINAVAIDFILAIDEQLFETFVSGGVKEYVERCQDYEPEDDQCFSGAGSRCADAMTMSSLLPLDFIICLGTTIILIWYYLVTHCQWDSDTEQWVSIDMHLPTSPKFTLENIPNMLFPGLHAREVDEPYWTFG